MSEHKHGEMNIDDHEKTFNGFVKAVMWSCVAIIAALIFMALVNS
ncbi:MAG: aa3-type cytochrome c oxidase subunit IV [Roseovarius sp.]|nr:aa3-type cytochrome c oxidase subunit IV [Roseovarius sp.]MCY4207536.1 aa3-type cytochrome c oxidase subunit IV [Roseovarius sp.]MCY4290200.1 aa3-type cytochrome c oxidase subunit IV [Roseovarius sp.]